MKKKFISFLLLTSFLCFGLVFALKINSGQNVVFAAENEDIIITGTSFVNLENSQTQFSLVATVSDTVAFSGTNVVWFVNNSSVPSAKYSAFGKKSTLTFVKEDYANITADTTWAVKAQIEENPAVFATFTILFKKSSSPVTIINITPQVQEYSESFTPFEMYVENPNNQPVSWFKLDINNKFISLPLQAIPEEFTFTPILPGSYSFVAKVGEFYSDIFTFTTKHKPLTELKLSLSEQQNNSLGFKNYLFTITNVDDSNDIANIKWYIKGYTNPVQYGGRTFLFEPTQYASYTIYARYSEPNEPEINSDQINLVIKIDRTLEVIAFTGGLILVMGIGLIIIIKVKIKNDKVW